MTYVITGDCCADASCVNVCPVDCIHPGPSESGFTDVDTLSIDPKACIDCGACSDACPVGAAVPADRLDGTDRVWIELNARATADTPVAATIDKPALQQLEFPHFGAAGRAASAYVGRSLRVAIVGTGPSAAYTARALLRADTEVTVIDREHAPGGLLRGGVAPDHLGTREINDRFATTWRNPRVRVWPGIEVGRDLSPQELLEHHDAVVLAVGAGHSRRLNVPGEELAGSYTAEQIVGWYNTESVHTDATPLDLSSERAVVVGTGNVALDVARVVLSDPESLTSSAISERALADLRDGRLREIVLLARRGPDALSCSYGEMHALIHHPGIDVVVAGAVDVSQAAIGSPASLLADLPRVAFPGPTPPPDVRRVVLCFDTTIETIGGDEAVTAVVLTGRPEPLRCGLIITAIGYRSRPPSGVAVDEVSGVIANRDGRVLDAEAHAVPGLYVTGWAKRGPAGGIGANRADAEQTVAHLLTDAAGGRLLAPVHGRLHLSALLTARGLRERVAGSWLKLYLHSG